MALVLALRKDQSFFVGADEFTIKEVYSQEDFLLENVETKKVHRVTDRKMVEVLPKVYISVGDRQQTSLIRIAIEAPRDIKILRSTALEKEV